MFRWWDGMWLALALSLAAAPTRASEASLEAAFVYNFIKFIDWPTATTHQRVHLCVTGADAKMRDAFDLLQGKPAQQRIIDVEYLTPATLAARLPTCHMVFQPSVENLPLPHPLPLGVVLVAHNPSPNDPAISIALRRTSQGRLEFSISLKATSDAGVIVSSQLLKLAVNNRE